MTSVINIIKNPLNLTSLLQDTDATQPVIVYLTPRTQTSLTSHSLGLGQNTRHRSWPYKSSRYAVTIKPYAI
jgi:hypothetical protein